MAEAKTTWRIAGEWVLTATAGKVMLWDFLPPV